ncbi:hypothetical protein BDN67DRAFT_1022127 [Paxillus ammoniavirescens]|nr:hypothetical protein BDN67DRAFT_1022127 [Paxillus ammoniavirescens]
MLSNDIQLADAALTEALNLVCKNKDLLSPDQRDMLLDTQVNLRKQYRKLEPLTWRWFSWGSDKSKKHLENSRKFLTEVKVAIETTMVTNARNGSASSTPTGKSFDTAKASTCHPSKALQSLGGSVGATTAPPNPQDGNTGVSYSEMPPPYTSASADAINTPLAPRQPSIGQQSLRGGVEATTAPPNPQGRTRNTGVSSSKTAPPARRRFEKCDRHPTRLLVAATAKQAWSGKAGWPRPPPSKRHTKMSDLHVYGSGSAGGLTINMGGIGNCGSGTEHSPYAFLLTSPYHPAIHIRVT